MTPGAQTPHTPYARDCCLTCWKMLDGELFLPIFCIHCESLRCPHATNHNAPCPAKYPRDFTKPLPKPRRVPRFELGKALRA